MIENILVLDDEENARLTVKSYILRKFDQAQIHEAGDIETALEIVKRNQIDLAFLDIHLGNGTGFDFLNQVPPALLIFKVIFVSAHDEFGVKAFKYNALDYILKPINPIEFNAALDKVENQLPPHALQLDNLQNSFKQPTQSLKKIVLKDQNSVQLVAVDDIVYCKSENNYTTFHLKDRTSILISQTLKEYEQILKDRNFFRAHRSFLINLDLFKKYDKRDGGVIVMDDDTNIPLARGKKEILFQILDKL